MVSGKSDDNDNDSGCFSGPSSILMTGSFWTRAVIDGLALFAFEKFVF